MIERALLFVPGAGPWLAIFWRFLTSPIGRAIVLGVVAFTVGYQAKAKLDATAQLRARLDKVTLERNAASKASADANKKYDEILDLGVKLRRENEDYAAELAKRPDPRCTLTDDDIRRVWGTPGRRRR